eukprot:1983661-Ditylum_brightwellii.AAC.1
MAGLRNVSSFEAEDTDGSFLEATQHYFDTAAPHTNVSQEILETVKVRVDHRFYPWNVVAVASAAVVMG